MTLEELRKKDGRVILYDDGFWTIRKWNMYDGSFVMHDTCGQLIERHMLSTRMCDSCNIPVPDKVVVFWTLDNFDRISQLKSEYGED